MRQLAMALLTVTLLCACGQRGNLYLPDSPPGAVKPTTPAGGGPTAAPAANAPAAAGATTPAAGAAEPTAKEREENAARSNPAN